MTINMGTPSPAPAGPAKTHAKEKQGPGSTDASKVGGGFEAILSSLEQDSDPTADDSSKATAASADVLSSDASITQEAESPTDTPMDPALLLAGLGFPVPTAGKIVDSEEAAGDAVDPAGVKRASRGLLLSEKLTAGGSGGKNGNSKGTSLDGIQVQDSTELPKEITPAQLKASKDQKMHQSQSLLAATVEARVKSMEIQTEQSQSKSTALLEMANSKDANVEMAKRSQEPLAAKQVVVENVGGALQSQAQPAASLQSTEALIGSMPTAEVAAGQQVNYWIASDIQSAEMKLDGLGKGPVEVSINVHGKEADVTFRTDEVQTRELLESSTGSLKELMGREGMVLTGMTVGAHGSGNPNPNGKGGGKHQQSLKPIIGSIAPAELANSALKPLGPIGKSLDLFV